ncbi:MAG: xanthine dehydrogenase family protein subunit M [Alphaproteobacteria bacterium]|nr:xanthine dehydrogenase family protein subunit M [Alphaproteobacteria bacterium]
MQFARPTSLEHALDHLAAGPWCVLAGGTDVYPAQVDRPIDRPMLDISRLFELRGIERTADGWRIGGLTRWRELLAADLPPAFDGLKQAAIEVGSVQIQNAGTVAGNLCSASPAADGVPPLLTLDALVELASTRGVRRLPLQDFITGYRATAIEPDELLTAILIPEESARGASHFEKLGARKYLVISIVMVAVRLVAERGAVTEARAALGACSPVALRMTAFERDLIGAPLDRLDAVVTAEHLEALRPIDDIRASAAYRREAASVLLRRSLAQTAAGLR